MINQVNGEVKRYRKLPSLIGVNFIYNVTDVYRTRSMRLWARVKVSYSEEEVEFIEDKMNVRCIRIEKIRRHDKSKVGEREILVGTRQSSVEKAYTLIKRYIGRNEDISLAIIEEMLEDNTKDVFDRALNRMVPEHDPIPNPAEFDSLSKITICRHVKKKYNIPMSVALNMGNVVLDFKSEAI